MKRFYDTIKKDYKERTLIFLKTVITNSPEETIRLGAALAKHLRAGDIVAMFGGMGMGKTAFTRGLAAGLGLDEKQVSSPTFALVHEYGTERKLYHFDMYRIETWDDLDSTGFFEYPECGGILAVEWSENIENALPPTAIRVSFAQGDSPDQRIITIDGGAGLEYFSD